MHKLILDLKKFWFLWNKVQPDCRSTLLEEFLFNPRRFEMRFQAELNFQLEYSRRWR